MTSSGAGTGGGGGGARVAALEADVVLVLVDLVLGDADADHVKPELTLVALHPAHLLACTAQQQHNIDDVSANILVHVISTVVLLWHHLQHADCIFIHCTCSWLR